MRYLWFSCLIMLMSVAGVACKRGPQPCTKVDLLFVIDNSGSMADDQQNLVRTFPKFADEIKRSLGEEIDYHVGVVTSDAYAANEERCRQLGALVTQTGGNASSGKNCGPFKHGRFISVDDDLTSAFTCLAQVGSAGSPNEDMIGAAEGALSAANAAPGGCNEGFLRPDSLLVVVLLTDEDQPNIVQQVVGAITGTDLPGEWQRRLAVASGHSPNKTVMVSILKGIPGNRCAPGAEGSDCVELIAMTNRYKYNHLGDVCSDDHGGLLLKALGTVATACENIELEDTETCLETGPKVKDWLFSSLLVLLASLVLSIAGLATLSRSLARGGWRQDGANLAGIGLGLFLGGIPGMVVTVVRQCALASGPGYLGIVVSLIGVLILALGLMGRKGSK